MINVKIIFFGIIALLINNACTTVDDGDVPGNVEGSTLAVSVITGGGTKNAASKKGVNIRFGNDPISLRDLSTLASGRTWIFPENLVDIIGSDNDVTSNSETVSFRLKNANQKSFVVELKPDFDFPSEEPKKESILFNVFDKLAITDLQISNRFLSLSSGEITLTPKSLTDGRLVVESGQNVQFSYDITGQSLGKDIGGEVQTTFLPDGVDFSGIFTTPPTTKKLSYTFQTVGTYNMILQLKSSNPKAVFNRVIPVTVVEATTPLLPSFTKINENSKIPFLVQNKSNEISIVTGRFLDTSVDFTDALDDFNLLVNGGEVVINNIRVDQGNPSALLLTPESPISFRDLISLSYGGTIVKDIFGNELIPFTNATVLNFIDDELKDTVYNFNSQPYVQLFDNSSAEKPAIVGVEFINFGVDLGTGLPKEDRVLTIIEDDVPTFNPAKSNEIPSRFTLQYSQKTGDRDGLGFPGSNSSFTPPNLLPGNYRLSFFAKTNNPLEIQFFGSKGFAGLLADNALLVDGAEWKFYEIEFSTSISHLNLFIKILNQLKGSSEPYELLLNNIQLINIGS